MQRAAMRRRPDATRRSPRLSTSAMPSSRLRSFTRFPCAFRRPRFAFGPMAEHFELSSSERIPARAERERRPAKSAVNGRESVCVHVRKWSQCQPLLAYYDRHAPAYPRGPSQGLSLPHTRSSTVRVSETRRAAGPPGHARGLWAVRGRPPGRSPKDPARSASPRRQEAHDYRGDPMPPPPNPRILTPEPSRVSTCQRCAS